MLNLFKSKNQTPLQSSVVLRVIGDRASGKTTYMASLARWPNADPNSPVQAVTAVDEGGEDLINKAQNILEQGLQLEPNKLENISEVTNCTLQISLKEKKIGSPLFNLNISSRDYSGEFFSDLLHQSQNPQLEEYLEDCLQANGIMFLVDGSSRRKDLEYANGLDKLLLALDRNDITGSKRRIALVLNKCEQSDLWVNRDKPGFLASARFPQVCRKLQAWQQMGGGEIEFFTASAFGMLGNKYPEPNVNLLNRSRGGVRAVIKNPKLWRPFGLVAPIYWLAKGSRHPELDHV
ncbi:GTPase domain-containing protein [Anabaena aphanizomenioides LEGE 00250]|uniref:GTPase domain-containing protein n=1 Tax=Sphaerospermopsis aphanizomenoides LEGE 00250 TaxID=2777972 RepID=A0ABR9VK34_9CYAN|nr:GTPase domain-containing protein [Sphaerospermopsis aphanizomenoides]MBE9238854.1 GTPase domain-containing protein [Sphaerospermopsis aphanizomenoides LEGE 00250]